MRFSNPEWQHINDELLAEASEWWSHPLAQRWLMSTSKETGIDWRNQLANLRARGSVELLDFTDPPELINRFKPSAAWTAVTEKTASQLYQLGLIRQMLGAAPHSIVVEIGAGYGNLARLALLTSQAITEWHIIDLPAMIAIQQPFLRKLLPGPLMKKVRFHDAENLSVEVVPQHNLTIAAFSVTETPTTTIDHYCATVFAKSVRAWIVGQWTFIDGSKTMHRLLASLLHTHDCAWRPFIYCVTDSWPTAEVHATSKSGPGAGRLTRLVGMIES